MMSQAFYTGISGLKTNQTSIDVISDNIANISTVGFRGYNTEFATLFENSLNSTSDISSSVGNGVALNSTSMLQNSGTIMLSDKSTDLAIDGDGWFGIAGDNKTMFTRSGQFTFDAQNDLVTPDGYYVLGTMGSNISSDGTLNEVLSEVSLGVAQTQQKLRFPKNLTIPVQPTTTANLIGNIGVGEESITIGAGVIDPQNNRNHLRLSFTKVQPQVLPGSQWSVEATTQTLDGETIFDTKTGLVNFDSRGAVSSSTLTTIDNNGASVAINLGEGFDGVVSIGNIPTSSSSSADGTMGGDLEGYEINQNAEVIATFTNGMQSSVGKIALYHFLNDQGLDRAGGSRFLESSNSGRAFFNKDATGQSITGSKISNYSLESSNVKMEAGLTDLIIYQRAFDANSKSISTADEMMQKALNMSA